MAPKQRSDPQPSASLDGGRTPPLCFPSLRAPYKTTRRMGTLAHTQKAKWRMLKARRGLQVERLKKSADEVKAGAAKAKRCEEHNAELQDTVCPPLPKCPLCPPPPPPPFPSAARAQLLTSACRSANTASEVYRPGRYQVLPNGVETKFERGVRVGSLGVYACRVKRVMWGATRVTREVNRVTSRGE